MAESKRRIIVDGVDFPQLFQFPKLFRAIPLALQPSKLIVALFMVLLLVAVGRVWDGLTPDRGHPNGLHHGVATEEHVRAAQGVYRRAMQDYAPPDRLPSGEVRTWDDLEPGRVLRDIRAGYREDRRRRAADAATPEDLRERDERYLNTVNRIHQFRPKGTFEATGGHIMRNVTYLVGGVVSLSPGAVVEAFANLVVVMPTALWRDHKVFTIAYGLIFLIVGAIGGGAISRMTAMEIAGQERLRARDALQFSMTNWPRFVLAPLLPLVLLAVIALLIAVLGVLTNVPVLDIIAGVFYILGLLLGFVAAFLLIGYVAALPMFVPAIACENCDAADAQQRSYAYVVSRPLHLLGYAVIALIALALGFLLVSLFAWATLNVTGALFGAWTRSPAATAAGGYTMFELFERSATTLPGGWSSQVTAWLISLWQTLVISLVAAFIVAFAFAASTILYLLMRRASDGQAIEEVWHPGLVPGTLARAPEPAPAPAATESESESDSEPEREAESRKPKRAKKSESAEEKDDEG